MLQLDNQTPLEAAITVIPDASGVDTVHVRAKATFAMIGRVMSLAPVQEPLEAKDNYRDDPLDSAITRAGEMLLCRSATDFAILGDAMAPGKKLVPQLDVAVTFGSLRKSIRVCGDRYWEPRGSGYRPSEPVPFEQMAVSYDRAFGGSDHSGKEGDDPYWEPRNPIGRGFLTSSESGALRESALPNLEYAAELLRTPGQRPAPASFGFVGPAWAPRSDYAGTYDEAWKTERAPYLPEDFDQRFLHPVADDQVFPGYLAGGERISITNMHPEGPIQFTLPVVDLGVEVRLSDRVHGVRPVLEAIVLRPNELAFTMTWCGAVPAPRRLSDLAGATIGERSGVLARMAA